MANAKSISTPPVITAERMIGYRAGAQKRRHERARRTEDRRTLAWSIARECSRLPKTRFGASKVVLFGSLAANDRFHIRSDVDLAAWGMESRLYLRAVASLLSVDPEVVLETRLLAELDELRDVAKRAQNLQTQPSAGCNQLVSNPLVVS